MSNAANTLPMASSFRFRGNRGEVSFDLTLTVWDCGRWTLSGGREFEAQIGREAYQEFLLDMWLTPAVMNRPRA